MDQADRLQPAGLARPLLQLASVLDPAGIPQAVLSSPPIRHHLAGHLPAPATGLPVNAGLPDTGHLDAKQVGAEQVDAVLRVLHRYSLIDHDRTAVYRQVRVHQLVQRATRENLTTHPGHSPAHLAAVARAAADALLAVWPPVERDELSQVLRANTTALHQAAAPALWDHTQGGHQVLFRAATSLGDSGQVTAAIDAYTTLHHTARHHLGPDHPDTLATRRNLVVIFAARRAAKITPQPRPAGPAGAGLPAQGRDDRRDQRGVSGCRRPPPGGMSRRP